MGTLYLVPSLLHEEGMDALPAYLLTAIRDCRVLFVENERTARRFLKLLDKSIVIDDFEWHTISESPDTISQFRKCLDAGRNAGIISEAGCPGIADPGQALVRIAQEMNVPVKPLVGPNSILLALMASGMNGQHFSFQGYLPIQAGQRVQAIRELEAESARKHSTQIFIETPYRNNQLMEALVKICKPSTRICIACNLTAKSEWVKTKPAAGWTRAMPDLHKKPVIFLLDASREAQDP